MQYDERDKKTYILIYLSSNLNKQYVNLTSTLVEDDIIK